MDPSNLHLQWGHLTLLSLQSLHTYFSCPHAAAAVFSLYSSNICAPALQKWHRQQPVTLALHFLATQSTSLSCSMCLSPGS